MRFDKNDEEKDEAQWSMKFSKDDTETNEDTLTQNGIDSSYLKIEMELNSIEAIKNAVHSGLGAAFVSVSAISKELELNMVHWAKIEGVTIKRTLSILLNPKRYHSTTTTIFKEEILEMFLTTSSKNKIGS